MKNKKNITAAGIVDAVVEGAAGAAARVARLADPETALEAVRRARDAFMEPSRRRARAARRAVLSAKPGSRSRTRKTR
ncbi:MAG: hypothetical protein ACT4O3_08000 [Elusimicrobiota bacterium]